MPSVSFLTTILMTVVLATAILSQPHCTTNTALAHDYHNGTILMNNNPLTQFDAPMTSGFNITTDEDWSFEGISADGQAGMGFTFSRGTVAANLLAQRMFIAVVWPNGTRFMESSFADISTIQECKDKTIGTWYNETSGMNWTFESTKDYSRTVVNVKSDTVQGTYTLDAISPPVYPNGLIYPSEKGDTLFAPYLYWVENAPVGVVEANLIIRGTPFTFKGIGGRERNWNSFAWAQISTRWDMVRASVGPYTFMAWTYLSKVDGLTYFSSVIMRGKEVVFRTQTQEPSTENTYGSFSLTYNGTVHLSSDPVSTKPIPESRHTGYVLTMVDSKTKKQWKFSVDYTKCVYWFPAGAAAKIGGFVGAVKGGLVGGPQYIGRASGNNQEAN